MVTVFNPQALGDPGPTAASGIIGAGLSSATGLLANRKNNQIELLKQLLGTGGTVAAIQADSDVGAGATLPSNASWIRFTNSGAGTGISNLFNVPSTMVANAVSVSATKTIKIIDSTGTAYYLMVSAAA